MCEEKDRVSDTIEINGVVLRKYVDPNNHMVETLDIDVENKIVTTSFLANEQSAFYEKIMEGDSLVKKKGTLAIQIIRDDIIYDYTLDYKCDDYET